MAIRESLKQLIKHIKHQKLGNTVNFNNSAFPLQVPVPTHYAMLCAKKNVPEDKQSKFGYGSVWT